MIRDNRQINYLPCGFPCIHSPEYVALLYFKSEEYVYDASLLFASARSPVLELTESNLIFLKEEVLQRELHVEIHILWPTVYR